MNDVDPYKNIMSAAWPKGLFIHFCYLLISFLTSVSFTFAANNRADTAKPLQTIIVDKYYPYTFMDKTGKPDGFSVDLIKAVTKAMDLELEIRSDLWSTARSGLKSGEIDFLPMMAYSKDRDRHFDFSTPHTIAFDAFFTRKNSQHIESLDDLGDKTIIVMGQDQAYDFLKSVDFISQEQLTLINSVPEALKMLSSGKGDAVLMPKLVGLVFIKRLNLTNLEMSPIVIEAYKRPFSFAVREGNQVLLERLTQGLMIIKETGEYQTIYKKWFSAYEPAGISWSKILKYFLGVLALFVLVSSVLLAWSLSLKKQVARRTRLLAKEVKVREEAEIKLQKAYDELEDRVRDRTSQLMESEKKYRKINDQLQNSIDSMPTAYILWNIDNQVVEWNKAAEDIFGYSKAEMLGKNAVNYIVPEEVRHLIENVLKKLKAGEVAEYSERDNNIRKDGEVITCQWYNTPLADEKGNIAGFLTLAQDITFRILAEEGREKLIRELRKALENVKILRGLLPICANCKKIRDDKGYWNHLESYLEKHSSVSFSHGMCNECAEKLYGKENWYLKMKKNEE